MTKANEIMTLGRLQHVLDVHGADVARWPQNDALSLPSFLASSAEARQLMAEAVALDRLMSAAPSGRSDRLTSLADRIVVIAGAAKITQLPDRTFTRPIIGRSRWPAIAAMAASLLIGVYGGFNGWTPQVLQQVAELSVDDSADQTVDQSANDDDAQYGDIL